VYSGKMYLPEVFKRMEPPLRYKWMIAARFTTGNLRGMRNVGMLDAWRPIVVFGHYTFRPTWTQSRPTSTWPSDLIEGPAEKDYHPWQQSLAEAETLIEEFTLPGDLVLDPMCGAGTVLVAAKKLGRRFQGFELDAEQVAKCRERLAEVE
jgi:DNA modification methylase